MEIYARSKGEGTSCKGLSRKIAFILRKRMLVRLAVAGCHEGPVQVLSEKINGVSQERFFLFPYFSESHASDGNKLGKQSARREGAGHVPSSCSRGPNLGRGSLPFKIQKFLTILLH